MYVIVSYDVEVKKCQKLLKLLRKYLFHVYNSVFEGELTDKEETTMKEQIQKIINNSESSVIIYRLPSNKPLSKSVIGKQPRNVNIII